jgi:hypothetical protein
MRIRTPYCDNDALYHLLGPSLFDYDPDADESAADSVQAVSYEADDVHTESLPDTQPALVATPLVLPNIPEKRKLAEEISLPVAIAAYNEGFTSRQKLAKLFGIAENQGQRLKEMIEAVSVDG